MSKTNGADHPQLTVDDLRSLAPLAAGDYYYAKQNAPKADDGSIDGESFAFYAMAHAAKRKGLIDSDDVYALLDRVDLVALNEASVALTEGMRIEGPLPKTRTGNSRRSVTSGG